MRDEFGTNERKIESVLEKRDWDAFSEMLQLKKLYLLLNPFEPWLVFVCTIMCVF